MDDRVWDTTTFSKNRERLLSGDIAQGFFPAVLEQARARKLLSSEHFSVDGTLIEAWASQKGSGVQATTTVEIRRSISS
jgi:transposase